MVVAYNIIITVIGIGLFGIARARACIVDFGGRSGVGLSSSRGGWFVL